MERKGFNTKLVVQLIVLGVLLTAIYKFQFLIDQYALATFRPTAEVQGIIDRLKLTSEAKGILARTQPEINSKADFNANCQTNMGDLELGCYTRGRIYVLRIENPDLAPEMDVVMAHELLHAAYDRLGKRDQARINASLQTAYAKITDEDLRERMASYARTEPGEENNELHSILGTEFGGLSADLEGHYRTYFDDRSVIVAAQQAYQNVFTSRRQQLERELGVIRSLKLQLTTLNRRMEGLKASNSIAAYNALVPQQNQLVDNINARIKTYQQGVDEYNALSKALDSQQITVPQESPVQ